MAINDKQNGTIGNTLKTLREKRKLSMANVATALGVSVSAYQKYENNTRDVSTILLNSIADFYGVTTDYLLGREPQPNPLAMLNISVNDKKFIEIYNELSDLHKQIFVDTMIKLSEAGEQHKKKS